jgi:hypothetical protein
VAKSLVTAAAGGPRVRYRLIETTRAYSLEKLVEAGEFHAVARRNAEYFLEMLERTEPEWETGRTTEWAAEYGREIDNLRAALDWAFSPGGDASIGIALTSAAVPQWMHLSLLDECRGRAERALAVLNRGATADRRREMKLYAALGVSLRYGRSRGAYTEVVAALTRALELAESLDDVDYQLRSGSCRPFASSTVSIRPHWPWPRDSALWLRTGPIRMVR